MSKKINRNELRVAIDNAWHCYDIYSLNTLYLIWQIHFGSFVMRLWFWFSIIVFAFLRRPRNLRSNSMEFNNFARIILWKNARFTTHGFRIAVFRYAHNIVDSRLANLKCVIETLGNKRYSQIDPHELANVWRANIFAKVLFFPRLGRLDFEMLGWVFC